MFTPDVLSRILRTALFRGGDYCDVFIEERDDTAIHFDNGKIRSITTGKTVGIGIRVIYGINFVYFYSSDPSEKTALELAGAVAQAVRWEKKGNLGELNAAVPRNLIVPRIEPRNIDMATKVAYVERANQAARDHSTLIREVIVSLMDSDQKVTIAASDGNFVNDRRVRTKFMVKTIAARGDEKENGFFIAGRSKGWEFFDEFTAEFAAQEAARIALVRLDADYAPQGKTPVVIDNGDGGVIFHEACGHALESAAVADNASAFCGKMGQSIASPIVNAYDDGTVQGAWGSADFDDEGNPTRRNQLIKDGVLTSYLIDKLGSIKMGLPGTHSGRRESYRFAPASRMTNTFIGNGNDTVDAMIASITHGLYCKNFNGGSADPITTDFNFAVQEGYLIKNGKINKPVKGASLIGKGSEILMNIEMVGDNLDINGTGQCGAHSGWIPVNTGQPSIKVGGLIVGGR